MDHAMRIALEEARQAAAHDDVPIGAVVLSPTGDIVARTHNRRQVDADPTAHAEILALSAAARDLGTWRLDGHTLVVTLEPCAMCAGAGVNARIARLVYGAADGKAGACWSLYNIPQDRRLNHYVEMDSGVLADECGSLLSDFFQGRR